jgi:hypothetical protein
VYGELGVIPLLLVVPLVTTGLTVLLVLFTFHAWRANSWSFPARVHYSLVTVAALGFVWFLAYWNLLGFHY